MKNHSSKLDTLREQLATERTKEQEMNKRVNDSKTFKENTIKSVAQQLAEALSDDITELKGLYPLQAPITVKRLDGTFLTVELISNPAQSQPNIGVKVTRSDTKQVIIIEDVTADEFAKIIKTDGFVITSGENKDMVKRQTGADFLHLIKTMMEQILEKGLDQKVKQIQSNIDTLTMENAKINGEISDLIGTKNSLMQSNNISFNAENINNKDDDFGRD